MPRPHLGCHSPAPSAIPWSRVVLLLVALVAWSCSAKPGGNPDEDGNCNRGNDVDCLGILTGIAVEAESASVPATFSVQLRATGLFSDGTSADITEMVTWTSSSPTIATVSSVDGSRGVATGVAAGMTTITASFSSATATTAGTTTLAVGAATLLSLSIEPVPALPPDVTQTLTALGTFSDGSRRDLTEQVTWTISDTSVATVSNAAGSKGRLTGVAPGTTDVSVSRNAFNASASVTVPNAALVALELEPGRETRPAGHQPRLRALGIYTDGSVHDLSERATWTSSAPAIASVSNTSGERGLVTGVVPGMAIISAAVSGLGSTAGGNAELTITDATLVSLDVSPDDPTVPGGLTEQFRATATYSDGASFDVTELAAWTTASATAVSISNAPGTRGRLTTLPLTASTTGIGTVTAAFGALRSTTGVTVDDATLTGLDLGADFTLPAGISRRLTAIGTFSDGSSRDLTDRATWTTSAPGVASVSTVGARKGMVMGVAFGGPISVVAALGAVSDTTALTVSGATPSWALAPLDVSIPRGLAIRLRATTTDGSALDVTEHLSWTSSNPAVASVSNEAGTRGNITTSNLGTTTITAVGLGSSQATSLSVFEAVLTSLTLSGLPTTIAPNASTDLHVTGNYTNGRTYDLTEAARWTSSAPTIATVSNTPGTRGRVAAFATGSSTISVSFGGSTQTGILTVAP